MTATQTPCTPEADRFLRSVAVPDPPANPAGRRRYWDDTVMEALGELRRRLGSTREGISTQALLAIVDLEKHKMRHGRPVSGTHVPYLGELDQPSSPILQNRAEPPESPGPILENRATTPGTYTLPDCFDDTPRNPWEIPGPAPQVSSPPTHVEPATVSPTRERGPLAVGDQPAAVDPPVDTPQADGPRSRVGLTAAPPPNTPSAAPSQEDADRRRFARMRQAYLESTGRYAEDEFPDNPAYHRFRDEPRSHPAFLRWLVSQLGTGDDQLPIGIL